MLKINKGEIKTIHELILHNNQLHWWHNILNEYNMLMQIKEIFSEIVNICYTERSDCDAGYDVRELLLGNEIELEKKLKT